MPNKFFKRFMPDKKKLQENKALKIFGPMILAPELWRWRRNSVANGSSIGVFWSFFPIPIQVFMAAVCALVWRANLPLSIGLVWIANPLTIPPMYYFAYKVGTWILGVPLQPVHFHLSLYWLETAVEHIWRPLLLGGIVCGLVSAIVVNVLVRVFWALFILNRA